MTHPRAGFCLILLLSLGFTSSHTPQKPSTHFRTPEITNILQLANKHFTATDYEQALKYYEEGLSVTQPNNFFDRTSFLIGVGSCHLAAQRYSAALSAYAEADQLASRAGLAQHRIIIASNRASVYRRMHDLRSASDAIAQVEKYLLASNDPTYLAQAASVLRDIDFPRALPLFHAAIRAASNQPNPGAAASPWLQLGNGYLERGDLDAAEYALTEGFRLRMLSGGKQLQSCYYYLGRLRRLQNRPKEAFTLLQNAMKLAGRPGAHIPVPYVHHEIANTYLALGNGSAALEEFESAVQRTRELRMQVLPADTFRVSAEARLQRIFTDYVAAGMNQFRQSHDDRLSKRMFEVSEDSRAALFDETVNRGRELPPEYRQLLARYQRALAVSVGAPDAQESSELKKLRVELADAQARLGIRTAESESSHQKSEKDSPGSALQGLQRRLKADQALLSFHSGSTESFLWAVTRDSFETHILPNQEQIARAVTDFRETVRKRGVSREKGAALSRMLLGGLSRKVREKKSWVLSLDGPLFDLPFAALPAETGSQFLIEDHAIQTVPGAFVEEPSQLGGIGEKFVGVADARYNSADPRWHPAPARVTGPELARLPGTAREIRICARAWGRDQSPVLLTGEAVSREQVANLLEDRPAILHLAAHVMPHPEMPDQVMVALGLQPSGIGDYLSPSEIASQRHSIGLVTLSGCGSGSGVALPGLGLFGLTRAWLRAGASAVVASHWPIADDSGELLSAMYEELRVGPGPITGSAVAEALRAAQLRMASSRGWRSEPAYWAAFAVVGKD